MIFTIGHSNVDEMAFLAVAERGHVETVVDVRSHPGSNRCPQFNQEIMKGWLAKAGLGYAWEPRLGGWTKEYMKHAEDMAQVGVNVASYSHGAFPKHRIGVARPEVPKDRPSWTNQGLYDYSWFTSLDSFHDAIADLIIRSQTEVIAIMCAEALWWKCHRSMVADVLTWRGEEVIHLQPKLTSHRAALGNRIERYDPRIVARWLALRGA